MSQSFSLLRPLSVYHTSMSKENLSQSRDLTAPLLSMHRHKLSATYQSRTVANAIHLMLNEILVIYPEEVAIIHWRK